jgi:hypothetical protein
LIRKRLVTLALLLLAATAAPSARAEAPAIARPGLAKADTSAAEARGVVFFVVVPHAPGVAAVGTAHTFPLERIATADRMDFFLGRSLHHVATSRRFLVRPGKPFSLPGATIRGDFAVYALEQAPSGVRALTLASGEPRIGDRVALLGVPDAGKRDEDDIFGGIASVSRDRLDVDLDIPRSLEGWGGAPIIDVHSGEVLGILEAAVPHGDTARVIAAPIHGVVSALERPLGGGTGRAFAAFGSGEAPADPNPTPVERVRNGPLIRQNDGSGKTEIFLKVDYPTDGSLVTDSVCGTFITGRALAMRGGLRHFDVVMVIDTSRSTIDPAGTDINGNGKVGRPRLGRLGAIFGSGSTDPGDSILAAEVAAARQLLRGLDPRSTRVALVAFSGEPSGASSRRAPDPAHTVVPLTHQYSRISSALDRILASEPEGSTHMAAGVDRATIELLGLRGALSATDPSAEKVVFFFTDGQPTLPYGPDAEADNVRAVGRAARGAPRGGVRIHSFAIGPEALEGPIATVEMASRTDGFFTPVRHPGDLVDVVEDVSFANLETVIVTNTTNGEVASPFRATADGTFGGFLKMEPGPNRLNVFARADDGTEAEQTLAVTFEREAQGPPLPRELVVQRNRLLEDCLRDTKRLRIEAERQEAERVRRELLVEIERERARARSRADEQRKQLELEVDE